MCYNMCSDILRVKMVRLIFFNSLIYFVLLGWFGEDWLGGDGVGMLLAGAGVGFGG